MRIYRQREQFPRARQIGEHLSFPLDVALVAVLAVAICAGQLVRMENARDAIEHVQRAHVDAAVDESGHIRAGLLHVMIDHASLAVDRQATVMHRLLLCCLRAHDRNLTSPIPSA